jgi:sigma-B regulation protein RsbU (phosphoserine phosphatase)
MSLQSVIPLDATPAIRLKEYLSLARDMSREASPRELVRLFRSRSRLVVPHDHSLTVTRLGASEGEVRLLSSTLTGVEYDAWTRPDEPPRLRSPFLCQLMAGARPVKIDRIVLPAGDPAAPYMAGMNSLVASPLFQGGQPVHMAVLLHAQSAAYTLDDLSTLLLTSNLMGQAASQSELAQQLRVAYAALDREFRVVGEIQRGLLPPEVPDIAGVSVATHYETSTRAGGDYYDFFQVPGDAWGFFLADVSGHGAPAAVVMARLHALLHAPLNACPAVETAPAPVLSGLNHCLTRTMQSGGFVTAMYGVLSPPARLFRYSLAGHIPPRWFQRASGRVVGLPATEGLPLAINDTLRLSENTVQFEPGDRLLLFTDGITETFGPRREQFGPERLDAAIRRHHETPAAMIEQIMSAVREHGGEGPAADDRTLVAVAFE